MWCDFHRAISVISSCFVGPWGNRFARFAQLFIGRSIRMFYMIAFRRGQLDRLLQCLELPLRARHKTPLCTLWIFSFTSYSTIRPLIKLLCRVR